MKRRSGQYASLSLRAWRHEPKASAAHTKHVRLISCSTLETERKGIEGEAFDKTDYVSEHHQAPLALKKNNPVLSDDRPY